MSSSACADGSSAFPRIVLRRARLAGCGLALAGLIAAIAPLARAQDFGYRQLQGKVYGDHDRPINGAVVYLSDSRNDNVRTFISAADGSYRFAGLRDDTDYTVWATFRGRKSSRRTLSSFDQRTQVYFDLNIPVAVKAAGRSGS